MCNTSSTPKHLRFMLKYKVKILLYHKGEHLSRKKLSRVKITKVSVPDKVLIAGKWWKVTPFSPAQIRKVTQAHKAGKETSLGECWFKQKLITYHPVQHREELLDTLVHEGLHGILAERSYKFGVLAEDEDAIPLLVGDIMNLIKQVATVELKGA